MWTFVVFKIVCLFEFVFSLFHSRSKKRSWWRERKSSTVATRRFRWVPNRYSLDMFVR